MAEVITVINSIYTDFLNSLPNPFGDFFSLLLLVLLIFVYSVFIWKFYRFIAQRNILELNLNQYNRAENAFIEKFLAVIFFFLEYIVVMPFLIFFWFAVFTFFLILLTESIEIKTLLIISATIISAIRMSSYYKEDLAKDLAKLLPFTLLAISITRLGFLNFEKILTHLSQIPNFVNEIAIYLLFIIALESFLRFFRFVFSLFGLEEIDEDEKVKEDVKEEKE